MKRVTSLCSSFVSNPANYWRGNPAGRAIPIRRKRAFGVSARLRASHCEYAFPYAVRCWCQVRFPESLSHLVALRGPRKTRRSISRSAHRLLVRKLFNSFAVGSVGTSGCRIHNSSETRSLRWSDIESSLRRLGKASAAIYLHNHD